MHIGNGLRVSVKGTVVVAGAQPLKGRAIRCTICKARKIHVSQQLDATGLVFRQYVCARTLGAQEGIDKLCLVLDLPSTVLRIIGRKPAKGGVLLGIEARLEEESVIDIGPRACPHGARRDVARVPDLVVGGNLEHRGRRTVDLPTNEAGGRALGRADLIERGKRVGSSVVGGVGTLEAGTPVTAAKVVVDGDDLGAGCRQRNSRAGAGRIVACGRIADLIGSRALRLRHRAGVVGLALLGLRVTSAHVVLAIFLEVALLVRVVGADGCDRGMDLLVVDLALHRFLVGRTHVGLIGVPTLGRRVVTLVDLCARVVGHDVRVVGLALHDHLVFGQLVAVAARFIRLLVPSQVVRDVIGARLNRVGSRRGHVVVHAIHRRRLGGKRIGVLVLVPARLLGRARVGHGLDDLIGCLGGIVGLGRIGLTVRRGRIDVRALLARALVPALLLGLIASIGLHRKVLALIVLPGGGPGHAILHVMGETRHRGAVIAQVERGIVRRDAILVKRDVVDRVGVSQWLDRDVDARGNICARDAVVDHDRDALLLGRA